MPWWNRHRDRPRANGAQRAEPAPAESGPANDQPRVQPVIRDAERRRLARLLQRRTNLEYDIAEAETAFLPENQWTERASELDQAIAQARLDLDAIQPTSRTGGRIELPETPIEVIEVRAHDPATVVLRVGDVTLRYREEPDWAERGHQLALPQLTRADGDVDVFVPAQLPQADRTALVEHLRHGFAIVADEVLQRTVDGEPLASRTLADLARPCERCRGWLDPKGRCPACARLDWERQAIRDDLARLLKERDDVLEDLAVTRDRLPVLRRQLAETELDIAQLRAKGVDAG